MMIKFKDGSFAQVDTGVTYLHLSDRFVALHDFVKSVKLYSNEYKKELPVSTHTVYINDFVTDDWLEHYNLQLEKLITKKLLQSDSQPVVQRNLDIVMNQLSDKLFMLDLPVSYQRNLEFDLNLVKYFRLSPVAASSVQELFEQLIKVHSNVCPKRLLILNHIDDYGLQIDSEAVKDQNVSLLILR